MGRKRFAIALSVVAFVLVSIVLLLFQLGADEQVIQNYLPRIERKLGVKISYREASASLTGLSMKDVEIRPESGKGMLAEIDTLGISVRVGPLFVGEVDVTGVTADGLLVPLGSGIGGATFEEWKMVMANAEGGAGGGDEDEDEVGGSHPEFHLVSGEVVFEMGQFSGTVAGISGMFGDGQNAAFEIDRYQFKHARRPIVNGESASLKYDPEKNLVDIDASETRVDLNLESEPIKELFGDLNEISKEYDEGLSNGGGGTQRGDSGYLSKIDRTSVNLVFSEATYHLRRDDARKELQVHDGTVNISKRPDEPLVIVAGGKLPGSDSNWSVRGSWTRGKSPEFSAELPNMSLEKIGRFVSDVDFLEWEGGFADLEVDLEVLEETKEISIRGTAAVSNLTVDHERLSIDPVENFSAHGDFEMAYRWDGDVLDIGQLQISHKLARGKLRGEVHLNKRKFDVTAYVPTSPCGNLLDAFPAPFRSHLKDVRLTGSFSMNLHLVVDEDEPDAALVEADLGNQCRIHGFGIVPQPGYFKGPFSYTAYGPDGEDLKIATGLGTMRWAPLNRISPYIIEAVLTTEDGKFWRHKGITLPEVSRAIALNLRKDDLRHGASTITMQLAKNLFLTRERTLSRKLQELFFVWYLETYFEKEEILELYLNVIEFGPSIYGVLDASQYYFGRHCEELNALESVFLIKLLPSPLVRHRYYEKGEASDRLTKNLHKVLRRMLDRKRITRSEFAEATEMQTIVFHKQGDPEPPPRPPVRLHGANRQVGREGDLGDFPDDEPLDSLELEDETQDDF